MPAVVNVAPIVYVLDDDISIRESLDGLIRQAGWQSLSFSSARDFLSHQHLAGPCCLILDLALPDLNGLDLQQQIVAQQEYMPIIFITGYGDIPLSVRAMKAGAVEFFTKPFDENALLDAIRDAVRRSADRLDAAADIQILKDRYESLSGREREVMALVVTGLLNKQVGGKLGISEITVKAHRGRMMQKMKAASLADLVNIASGLGIPR
ncbi:MAG TPA: response regulator [Acidisoma sp.]|nr:response regulator [Acidisoma sp.]